MPTYEYVCEKCEKEFDVFQSMKDDRLTDCPEEDCDGNVKRKNWNFFSAGSSLATVMTLLLSWGFGYYVNNLAMYNSLYGSIGTLIVILLLIYFNAFVILIGFELNVSIQQAGKKLNLS